LSTKVSHTLKESVLVEGVERKTIEIRRLKGKDLRAMGDDNGSNVDKLLNTIQRLSGWPPEAMDDLDAADIEAIGTIVEGFMGRKRRA
jgi:hypothetical protein